MRTHSVAACAEKICGPDSGMKDPAGWVVRQIKRGRFEAYKVGRHYRMSQEQIDAAIETLKTRPVAVAPEPERPTGLSLTSTSARRLRRSA